MIRALALLLAGAVTAGTQLSSGDPVHVARYRFVGNTAYSAAELAELAEPYTGRLIAIEDLELLRQAITARYVADGYINSGAAIDDQEVDDGTVVIRVIEGGLSEVHVTGLKRLRPRYIASRLRRAGRAPLRLAKVQDALKRLNGDVNVARLNAELSPGGVPGASVMTVDAAEAPPYRLSLTLSNRRPPSVGSEYLELSLAHTDLLGLSDQLSLSYGLTNGGLDRPDVEPDNYAVSWTVPLTAADTAVRIYYQHNDHTVIEEPLDSLAISSESYTAGVSLQQPLLAGTGEELTAFVTGEFRRSQTYLRGEPFSFSREANRGEVNLSLLRLGLEGARRSGAQVLTGRTQLSLGTKAFDANRQTTPNGQFAAVLLQGAWVRRFNSKWQLVTRAAAQYAAEALPSLEQFSIGGQGTVRGYRENQLVRDRGLAATVEFQRRLWQPEGGDSFLDLAFFTDLGYAEDVKEMGPTTNEISSVGLGLTTHLWQRVDASLYWAYGLRRFDVVDRGLQDDGIHFQVSVRAF